MYYTVFNYSSEIRINNYNVNTKAYSTKSNYLYMYISNLLIYGRRLFIGTQDSKYHHQSQLYTVTKHFVQLSKESFPQCIIQYCCYSYLKPHLFSHKLTCPLTGLALVSYVQSA